MQCIHIRSACAAGTRDAATVIRVFPERQGAKPAPGARLCTKSGERGALAGLGRYKTASTDKCLIRKDFRTCTFFATMSQALDFSGAAAPRKVDFNKVIHMTGKTTVNRQQINDLGGFIQAQPKLPVA